MAPEPLVVQLMLEGGGVSHWSETIQAGEIVTASNWSLPGPHRVVLNGSTCLGTFEVASDRLSAVVLRIGFVTCHAAATIEDLPSS